jgi:putative redox protein
MELIALGLAGCTAMDVISILQKKKQAVTSLEVKIHADRASDYPKVFTHAVLEYQVTGHAVDEGAVMRAIELSVEKYCPVHAMLSQAFPIDLTYLILEDEGEGMRRVVAEGNFMPQGVE